jgi:hypothetical protein
LGVSEPALQAKQQYKKFGFKQAKAHAKHKHKERASAVLSV